jgi:hypothetical protein
VLDRRDHTAGGFEHFIAARLPCLGHGQQNALEAGTSVAIFAGEIRSAEEWPAVGRQDCSERPTALATDRLDRGLIAGIDVGAFIAVDFDGDEVFVDDGGEACVFVALAVHHMAPVAPHRANVEQHGLVLARSPGKSLGAPFIPLDGLMESGAEIGGAGTAERVGRCRCGHHSSV